jgi:hypothetical protein
MGKHDIWTNHEDEILINNYGKLKYKDIQKLIQKETDTNRSIGAIKTRSSLLKLSEPKEPIWTNEEDEILIKHHDTKSYSEISNILLNQVNTKRSKDAIYHRVQKLNLKNIKWWNKK